MAAKPGGVPEMKPAPSPQEISAVLRDAGNPLKPASELVGNPAFTAGIPGCTEGRTQGLSVV